MAMQPPEPNSATVGVHITGTLRDRLENEQARRIKARHAPKDRTLSAICRDALSEYLKKQELMS